MLLSIFVTVAAVSTVVLYSVECRQQTQPECSRGAVVSVQEFLVALALMKVGRLMLSLWRVLVCLLVDRKLFKDT